MPLPLSPQSGYKTMGKRPGMGGDNFMPQNLLSELNSVLNKTGRKGNDWLQEENGEERGQTFSRAAEEKTTQRFKERSAIKELPMHVGFGKAGVGYSGGQADLSRTRTRPKHYTAWFMVQSWKQRESHSGVKNIA